MRKYIFIISMVLSFGILASDLAKEKRWAEQVVDGLLDGEDVTLNDGTNDFLGIFTAADEPKANAIVIHGIGAHPDWPQVINPVRVGLAEAGINTLSIQMPVLANEAESSDYDKIMHEAPPRIEAAIAYLNECCKIKSHIVAHSMGARMSVYYLNANQNSGINKFVAIGMNKGNDVSKINIPVLDIYGDSDLPGVLQAAPARNKILKSPSSKVVIKDADHFMEGQEAELIAAIVKWLGE